MPSTDEIKEYLCIVKSLVRVDKYEISRNDKRQDNISLFFDYIINENKAKEILLSLETEDFSEKVENKHEQFSNEYLYIFGKEVRLINRSNGKEDIVELYIKFNLIESVDKVIVVSFHEKHYDIIYPFKKKG